MKKTGNIVILLVFCFYSFVFKTHYCYYINTDVRFHGDCNHEIIAAKEKGQYADVNFFPNHYHCNDYFKDAKPSPAKTVDVKNNTNVSAIIATNCSLITCQATKFQWNLPEIRSRGGPPLLPNSFRGPPLV